MTTIKIVLEADYNRGVFVAHCLDFDLVTTAPSQLEVTNRMQALIRAHLEYAAEYGLNPYCRAPQSYWDKIESKKFTKRDFKDHNKAAIILWALA